MKIAVLTEIINRKSGARAPLEIAKALAQLGKQVTIFSYHHNLEPKSLKELKNHNIQYHLISSKHFFATLELSNQLKKGHFDIINFHGTLPFFFAAKASGIPIVRTYYGTQLDPILDKIFPKKPTIFIRLSNWLANQYIKFTDHLMLRYSDQVIAISLYTKKELEKLYSIKVDYIHLGNNPKAFKAKKFQPKKTVSIISVSRIVPYKGFHKLIQIFNDINKNYPNIRLTIVGSSPKPTYLSYLKRIKNPNTKILTNVSDKKLINLYQQADIYATFDRYLFFGMPILEAAASSLPTVALSRCAAPELIKHNTTGLLAKDEKEFEKHLDTLITKPHLRKKMGFQASKYSATFSWSKLAKNYIKIFQKVINKNYIQNNKTL